MTNRILNEGHKDKEIYKDIEEYFKTFKLNKNDKLDLFENNSFTNSKGLQAIYKIQSVASKFDFTVAKNILIDGSTNFTKALDDYVKLKEIHKEINRLDKKMINKLSNIEFQLT